MKINENKKTTSSDNKITKEKIVDFFKDKKTRWFGIAFFVMIAVTIIQFVLPQILGK